MEPAGWSQPGGSCPRGCWDPPALGAELSCLWSAGPEPESHGTGDEDTAPRDSVSYAVPHATQAQRPRPRCIASSGSCQVSPS